MVVANQDPRLATDRKNYLKTDGGTSTREKLNPPPPDLWIGHDQLELKGIDGDETVDTTLARSNSPDYRSASSMDRTRNYGVLAYSGNFALNFSLNFYPYKPPSVYLRVFFNANYVHFFNLIFCPHPYDQTFSLFALIPRA